jgi:hypothetical protein
MKTTNEYYNRLKELKDRFPQLTFDNDGYEYISSDVKESHREQIEEIESILRETVAGFYRFDNFKPRKDGSFAIRLHYNYNHGEDGLPFDGVGYFDIKEFKNFKID